MYVSIDSKTGRSIDALQTDWSGVFLTSEWQLDVKV